MPRKNVIQGAIIFFTFKCAKFNFGWGLGRSLGVRKEGKGQKTRGGDGG